jgi:N-acetyl-beta-hexosaminidase
MLKKNILVLVLIVLATCLPLNSEGAKDSTNAGIYQAVLIPKPKRITYIRKEFELNAQTVIATDQSSLAAAEYLQTELRRLYNIDCRVLQNVSQKSNSNQISLQVVANNKNTPANNEGYALYVGKGQVSLKSKNPAGVFYGIQTLKQLLHHTSAGIVAQGCQITDEPALAWRGVYLNLRSIDRDPASIQAMKNLINTFASLKMNTMFFEIADNILFERQQFPSSASHALTKAQASDLVDYAKSLHFEVIPTIQMLSHAVWVMSNPQNIDLLEGKRTADWATAWCPTHPGVDKLTKDMLEETIEIFQPKYFHICMDEINYGPYHECDTCKLENPSALFLKSITRMHDIMAAKGVKTIMWHDTLLPTGQYMTGTVDKVRGWEIVDKLPKDIIIADWDYGFFDKAAQKRLRYFTKKGFKVLGATFTAPTGIQSLADGLRKESNTLGLFDTLRKPGQLLH